MSVRPWLEFKVREGALQDEGGGPFVHERGIGLAVALWQMLDPLGYELEPPTGLRPDGCENYLNINGLTYWIKIFLLAEPFTYWITVADVNYWKFKRGRQGFLKLLMHLDGGFKGDDRFQVSGWFSVWDESFRTPYPLTKEDRARIGLADSA